MTLIKDDYDSLPDAVGHCPEARDIFVQTDGEVLTFQIKVELRCSINRKIILRL